MNMDVKILNKSYQIESSYEKGKISWPGEVYFRNVKLNFQKKIGKIHHCKWIQEKKTWSSQI